MDRVKRSVAAVMVVIVALLHFAFLVLEMFYWDHPIGNEIFSTTPEIARNSATLAANQGLYNGFLAVGLLWGLFSGKREVILFFLGCVIVAGVFGAATASITILFLQAVPALIAAIFVVVASRSSQ
ncbi:Protein of unknown function DUF1304 [hydrothermal vent metagenome]|uniref:DUF1304 domain-containing protein n=1 Tax=hydrothermal vent metagenome TaxID=652676 RepID=A0A3B0S2H6_9ZZZZ